MSVLRVRGLTVEFTGVSAVAGVDLDVLRGEVLALVGESGSGKTMVARSVLGLLPDSARASGSVTVDGAEVLGATEDQLNRVRGTRAAMVFQEPQTALNPVRTVGWQIAEALRAHGRVSRSAARARAIELLELVGIPEPARRVGYYPHQLSGGQKQRVVIALALSGNPALLIADEPTTALDVTVQAEILELLRSLRDRAGVAILLITHNLGVVADLADRVVVLRSGRVVEQREVVALFDRPATDYTRALLAAVPTLPDIPGPEVAEQDGSGAAVVELERVSVTYPARFGRAQFHAVRDVTVRLLPGEVLGLVGESGSGKTTLGRLAMGLLTPTQGRVLLDGVPIPELHGAALRAARRGLAMVHQDPAASLDPRFSIAESIAEPLWIHRVGTPVDRSARVAELLDAVRLPREVGQRRPMQLSGGQRQRVALARALALAPRLLVADEPTSALDVSVQADVLELFAQLQREFGFGCLFISHDLAVVEQVADRVLVLRNGELVESGRPGEVFLRPTHDYTRRLVDSVPLPDPLTQRARRLARTAPARG